MANIRFVLMEGESEDLHGLLDRLALSPNGGSGVRLVVDGSAEPLPKALAPAAASAAGATTKTRKTKPDRQGKKFKLCPDCGHMPQSKIHREQCKGNAPRPSTSPSPMTDSPPGNEVPTSPLTRADTAGF